MMKRASSIPVGSQTLLRGLDVLEAVSHGAESLAEVATELGLSRSTAHRLASALVERGYLNFTAGSGYKLGGKLLDLGSRAQASLSLVQVARPHLVALASKTEDTVHLGIMDNGRALYLDKIGGGRRIEISSRIGERQPLHSTGLGKALLLDCEPQALRDAFEREGGRDIEPWLVRMHDYARDGYAFDLEENEDRVRCVAAPIRDAGGRIIAAISLSSLRQYMSDARMRELAGTVRDTASAVSHALGWSGVSERGSDAS